jgi:hypothetical protein
VIGYRKAVEGRFNPGIEVPEPKGWYYKFTTGPLIYFLVPPELLHKELVWFTFVVLPYGKR